MIRSGASISIVGIVLTLASTASLCALAETALPRPPAPCTTENGRTVCRAENALFVWCKTRSRLTLLEDAVARDPARDHVLIAEASRDQQCGTTAGVIMNVARLPEYTLEGTIHPVVSVKIFAQAKPAGSNDKTQWGKFVSCKSGLSNCSTTQSLFACPFDQAAQISKQTSGDPAIPYSKGCEVISTDVTFDVETTQNPLVVYAKRGTRHIGYVPTNVALGLVASGSFPTDLRGVWLSSEVRCREFLRNRLTYEHDDLLEITPSELRGYESTSRLLTMETFQPGTWQIEVHSSGEGEEWLKSITFQLTGDRLFSLQDGAAFERVRCVRNSQGGPGPRRPEDDVHPTMPHRADRATTAARSPNARAESYPISCKSWGGTVFDKTGMNSSQARMVGTVTKPDLQEYCERDPGGETAGGKLSIEQCVDKYMSSEAGIQLRTQANCQAGTIAFRYGSQRPMTARFVAGEELDTSCASPLSSLVPQFGMLCPKSFRRLGLR